MRSVNQDLGALCEGYVVCSCEGAAEEAVMDMLLDNECLIFDRKSLVGRKVTRRRKAEDIQQQFLNRDFSPYKVSIIRILDSRSEKFKLGKLYEERFPVYTIRTTPEIEMLLIIGENEDMAYRQQHKTSCKPSEYCQNVLKLGNAIKSNIFWRDYFSDVNKLLDVLRKYHERWSNKSEYSIYDLLKAEYK